MSMERRPAPCTHAAAFWCKGADCAAAAMGFFLLIVGKKAKAKAVEQPARPEKPKTPRISMGKNEYIKLFLARALHGTIFRV